MASKRASEEGGATGATEAAGLSEAELRSKLDAGFAHAVGTNRGGLGGGGLAGGGLGVGARPFYPAGPDAGTEPARSPRGRGYPRPATAAPVSDSLIRIARSSMELVTLGLEQSVRVVEALVEIPRGLYAAPSTGCPDECCHDHLYHPDVYNQHGTYSAGGGCGCRPGIRSCH